MSLRSPQWCKVSCSAIKSTVAPQSTPAHILCICSFASKILITNIPLGHLSWNKRLWKYIYPHMMKWILNSYILMILIIQKLLTLMLETGQSFLANLNAKYDTWNISGLRSGSGSSMNPTRINQNVKAVSLNTEAIRGTLKRHILPLRLVMLPINFGNVYRKYKNCYFIHYPKLKIGEGNGIPLQYSCLENPMDGGAW